MLKQFTVVCEVLIFYIVAIKTDVEVDASEFNNNPQYYCPDFDPQKSLDLDQLMGMWYGVEVIQHRNDHGHVGIKKVETCPVLHFSRIKSSDLQLFWSEKSGTVEYNFHIPKPTNPGFWMSFGPQNGTQTHDFTRSLVHNLSYRQFAGTVQVMKAVASHMVVTFCSPNSQLFTIILSRTTFLDKIEIRGVRNLLQRKSLNQFGISETNCNSANSLFGKQIMYIPIVLLIALILKKYVLLQ